jgi:hypothetical protein
MRTLLKKILGAAAAMTTAATVAATAPAASAVTPSCGYRCINIYSSMFGTSASFVMDTLKAKTAIGQPLILFRSSPDDYAEDFTIAAQGTVNDLYNAGLVGNPVWLHYGGGAAGYPDDQAYEFEYAPLGDATGLCAGTPGTATTGMKVSLQPCGVAGRTVWIVDTLDSSIFTNGVPLINGTDTNFSHPFVLTYPSNSYPTDTPRPGLTVTNLTGFSNGFGIILGSVNSNQLWQASSGVVVP